MSINVLLVDDHQMVRDGFAQLIELDDDLTVINSFENVESALEANLFARADVLVTDISMAGGNGFLLLEYVKSKHPKVRCIILSMYENSFYIQQAKALGVEGYITKRDASDVLVSAIKSVHAGNTFFSQEISEKIDTALSSMRRYTELTSREKDVFLALAKGLEIKQIASELDIAVKTVHSHRRNIMLKFNYNTNQQVVKFALQQGLIEPADLS